MESILNLTPVQSIFILALNAWIFLVFPIIVIRKLNYMTALLESQYQEDEEQVA